MSRGEQRVTPVVLTFNEEANLQRTLEGLTWAERVVVLDSGSTDRTESIARAFGNVSWHSRSFDDHRRQTEFGIHQTEIESEFVLFLDADMSPGPGFVRELQGPFLDSGRAGGLVTFQYAYEGDLLRGSVYPAQVRVFRAGSVRVTQEGHTQKFYVDEPLYRFGAKLVHDDRKTLERWVGAQLKYSALETGRRGSGRLRDRLRKTGLMAPAAFLLGYARAGGPLAGKAALRYAYERAVYEGLLALRLLRGEEEA